jgi:hypothetical protein
MPRRKRAVELKLRFYPGRDDDVVEWLEQFDGQPYGAKSQQVIEALRRGIGTGVGNGATASAPGRTGDLSQESLAEVRRIVEAAVATALGRLGGQIGDTGGATTEEDDETESLLSDLGAALVLEEND